MLSTLRRASVAFPLDWSHSREYRLYAPARDGLGPYYIGWDSSGGRFGEHWNDALSDECGVIVERDGNYHPIRIAQFALQQHSHAVQRGDASCRRAFLVQAQWLLENQRTIGGIEGCYPFPFAWKRYYAPAGFLSAMAQGEAISVLLRAAELTGSERLLQAALRAMRPFEHTIDRGGVTWKRADDVIFEEAAALPAAHILNGWIFASWGLFELRRIAPRAGELFEASAATLRRLLPRYDSGSWSFYSLQTARSGFRRLATLKYHAFHISQLRVLASMTGDPFFDRWATRWETYRHAARSRAAVWNNAAQAAMRDALRLA